MSVHLGGSGTHRGEFCGVQASGPQVRTDEFAVYELDGGLIRRVWVTADTFGCCGSWAPDQPRTAGPRCRR